MKCAWDKCDVEFAPRMGSGGCPQRFCCRDHKTAARVERGVAETAARLAATPPRPCETCGGPFRSLHPSARFCSDRCRERARVRDPEERREIGRRYNRRAWAVPEKKLRSLLRNRLFYALNGRRKPGSAIRDLGCTVAELKQYLERQFQPGMTWENWSQAGWHVDHIRPLASFDLTDRAQFQAACHYTNLQPLWAFDNLSKWCHFDALRAELSGEVA